MHVLSQLKQQPGTISTRGQLKLSLKVHNTELYRKSFQHSGARSWNLLPDHIKTTQDYHKFSKLAKNFITQYMRSLSLGTLEEVPEEGLFVFVSLSPGVF